MAAHLSAGVYQRSTSHNIINTGIVPMKLYSIFAPSGHRDDAEQHTCADDAADQAAFDGKTTE